MTRAQERTYGVTAPSHFQHWLGTMLCVLAELVLNVAMIFRMLMSRLSGECHADATPHHLPGEISGMKETAAATTTITTTARRGGTGAKFPSALSVDSTEDLPATVTAAATTIGNTILEADNVRVPGEGRGPAITSTLALPSCCGFRPEQDLKPVLGPASPWSSLHGRADHDSLWDVGEGS